MYLIADFLIRQVIGTTENVRRILFLLDFAFFDKLFLFFSYSLKQYRSRLIVWVLRNKFALNSHL